MIRPVKTATSKMHLKSRRTFWISVRRLDMIAHPALQAVRVSGIDIAYRSDPVALARAGRCPRGVEPKLTTLANVARLIRLPLGIAALGHDHAGEGQKFGDADRCLQRLI